MQYVFLTVQFPESFNSEKSYFSLIIGRRGCYLYFAFKHEVGSHGYLNNTLRIMNEFLVSCSSFFDICFRNQDTSIKLTLQDRPVEDTWEIFLGGIMNEFCSDDAHHVSTNFVSNSRNWWIICLHFAKNSF